MILAHYTVKSYKLKTEKNQINAWGATLDQRHHPSRNNKAGDRQINYVHILLKSVQKKESPVYSR